MFSPLLCSATFLLLGLGDPLPGDSPVQGPTDEAVFPGTARMREELERIRREARGDNLYLGWGAIETLRARIEELKGSSSDPVLWRSELDLGFELLRMGRTEEAIESYRGAVQWLEDTSAARPRMADSLRNDLAEAWYQLGTAYLRLAEDRNCCLRNNADSCLLPIQGGGLHDDQEGSRAAMHAFRESLARLKPNVRTARKARWLLNLAAMTLGEYPGGLTDEERIDAPVLQPGEGFPRYREIGSEVGLTLRGLAGGMVAEDFDGDGRLELLTSSSDADGPLRLYRPSEEGKYVALTGEVGLEGLFGGLNLVSADYDGDGDVDVLVLRGAWLRDQGRHPNSLLRNEGDGTFVDVTFEAGLGEQRYPTQTASFADYDDDGDLDLYVGNEAEPQLAAPGQLFRNEGNGTFVDVAAAAGVTNDRYAKAVAWGDYDNDGDPDLYVSNMGSPNRLYRNEGDGTFVDVARELGVERPISGFPCWWFDYDDDGALDLFAASYGAPDTSPSIADWVGDLLGGKHKGEPMKLYKGDGHGGFTDVTEQVGLTAFTLPMGSNYGDVDNDGFPDVYLGTGYPWYEALMPNVMWHNEEGRRFVDVSAAGGFAHLQKGHGIAFADLDGDGDQDVVARMGGAYPGDSYRCVLFENPGNEHAWLKVRLVGERSNSFGVGARIRVDVRAGEETRSIYRTVTTGGSFGCNPLRQEIGLGAADAIETLEVWWPTSRTRQVFHDVPRDVALEVHEGADGYVVVPVTGWAWADGR